MSIFVKDGKVIELTEEEAKKVRAKGTHVKDLTKHMTQDELVAFKKERYEKFIKPLMEHNSKQVVGLKKGTN